MTKFLKIGLIAALAVVAVNGETKLFWIDKSGEKHFSHIVDRSTVEAMAIEDIKNIPNSLIDTKIIIRQSWNCLCLSDDFTKNDYRVIGDRTAEIKMGKYPGYGVTLGYSIHKKSCKIPVLGDKDCSDAGLREEWTVKQKVKGKWVEVGRGWFKFSE
jgi:hypothetical protein